MARVMFGWPVHSDVGPLYTPVFTPSWGSWSVTLPLTNLQTRQLAQVARSADVLLTSTRFRLDLGADRYVSAISIPKHTISQAGKYRVLGVPSTSILFFDYEAGDDIAALGGVFARATAGTYRDSGNVLRTAGVGVIRDGHFVNGVRTTLLEEERIQLVTDPENYGAWTLVSTPTRTGGQADPAGGNTAYLLDDTSAVTDQGISENVVFTGDGTKAGAVFIRAGSASSTDVVWMRDITAAGVTRLQLRAAWTAGVPAVTVVGGSGTVYAVEPWFGAWYRVLFAVNGIVAANTNEVRHLGAASGNAPVGSTYYFGTNFWNSIFPASHQGPALTTRNRDQLYFAYTPVPQAMTAYADFYEQAATNWLLDNGNSARILQIGSLADAGARFILFKPSGSANYRTLQDNGGGNVIGDVGLSPVPGSRIQMVGQLAATGAVQSIGSKDGAAIVTGAQSGANALAATWAGNFIQIGIVNGGGVGGGGGSIAVRAVRVSPGVQTLATMSTIVYDSGWLDAWPQVYPAGSLPATDPRLVTGKYTAEEAIGFPMGFVVTPMAAGLVAPVSNPTLMRYVSVQIDDTTNAAGSVDLSRLMVTGGYVPTINPDYGLKWGWEDATERTVTDGGAALYNVKSRRRTCALFLNNIPEDEAFVQPYEMMRRNGISQQMLFLFDPEDTYHRQRRFIPCTFRELSALEIAVGPREGWPVGLVEEL